MIKDKSGKLVKFGLECVVFNNVDFLETTLRMFQPFIDKMVISTGKKSWIGNIKNDGSVKKVANKLMKEFDNIDLVEGDWANEAEQRNNGLDKLRECDYVFIVDSDELWPTNSIHKVMDYMIRHPGYTIFLAQWNTRFKKINWRINPRESFRPVVAINNKKGLKFIKNRQIELSQNATSISIPEDLLVIEHLSYVRSDSRKIKEKIQTFSHSNEVLNGVDWWYQNMYLQADKNSRNLHPTSPECYKGIKEEPIHPEIKNFLKKYSSRLFEDEK